jgi:hypothetical protein
MTDDGPRTEAGRRLIADLLSWYDDADDIPMNTLVEGIHAIEAEAAAGPRDEGLLEAAMRRAVDTDDLFALVDGGAWWSLSDTRVVARRILRECAALQAATPPEDEG